MKAELKKYLLIGAIALVVILIASNWSHVVALGSYVLSVLWPIFLSLVLAYIADIPLQFFERGYRRIGNGKLPDILRRPVCMVAAVLILVVMLAFIVIVVIPEFINAVGVIVVSLPDYIARFQHWLGTFALGQRLLDTFPDVFDTLTAAVKSIDFGALISSIFTGGVAPAMNNVLAAATTLAGTLGGAGVSIILAFTWLFEKERVLRQAGRLLAAYSGRERFYRFAHAANVMNRAFHGYIVGQFLGSIFEGALCALIMTILRLPYAASVSVLVGVTALIPVIGPIVGMIGGALLMLADSWVSVFVVLAIIFAVQQLWAAFLYPKFVGLEVGLPGMWIMVAITVGGLFGLVGMTVSVPLFATIYQLLREYVDAFEARHLEKREDGGAAKESAPRPAVPKSL